MFSEHFFSGCNFVYYSSKLILMTFTYLHFTMKKHFFVLALLGFSPFLILAQKLNGYDEEIKQKILPMMETYLEIFASSQQMQQTNQAKIEQFLALYSIEQQVVHYNDIEPELSSGEVISISSYLSLLYTAYPQGVSIKMNPQSVIISPAYRLGKKKNYVVNAVVDKHLFGLYKGETLQDFSRTLVFQFSFDTKSGSPDNFKIFRISTSENAFDIVNESKKQQRKKKRRWVLFTAVAAFFVFY